MKKSCLALAVCSLLFFSSASVSESATDGRTERGPATRPGVVFFRGLGNVVGLPFEVVTTLVREGEMHSRLWPATYPFRLVQNILFRSASAVTDMFFLPWVSPSTEDISPLTESMGLPDYPWEVH